ncbi:uncharacterized protein LOC117810076 [Xyrichtys novacula]|uniref:3',5'-cyclic-GMP phosphodiesterase n=1 Tax=Xyrichtys novacula TaxID=13765 RepID=A0AAV1EMC8_XYRNO|nr:uncharacterized protein LOC117810076 [Xyrichtys novacula]
MASTLTFLLLLLLLVSLASASHHMGGKSHFTYRGRNPDGTFRVDIYNRDTYDRCVYSHYWSCYQGNCGSLQSTPSQQSTIIDNSTNAPSYERLWCETEKIETRNLPSDKPFVMRAASCCWIQTRNSASNWRLLTSVDLGTRSDTGEPNRSPDFGALPLLRVPQNCPRTYKLVNFDPDGDKVRCRYGNIANVECGRCDRPYGFNLQQDTCTLQYNGRGKYDYRSYGLEMMVEDFPQRSITLTYSDGSRSVRSPPSMRWKRASHFGTTSYWRYTQPLSKLPLHFSFLVDQSVPSCTPGLYLPQLVSPTPRNEAHISAEVGKEVEIKVKAQSAYSTIENIIFSGPRGTRKQKTSYSDFVLTWTPTPDDLGHHYVLCFAVEAKRGSSVYQTEMRCVILDVGEQLVEANVICTESTMRVEVDKSTFPRLHEDHLRLSDPSNIICSLQTHSNSTHVIAIFPLNACGTQIEEDDKYLKFKNEITTFDNLRDVITRKHLLEVQFYCQYPKRGNVTHSFRAHRENITVWEKGFGKFTYQCEFYPNSQFHFMLSPSSYPLEYDLGDRIFMQIEATSSVNDTVLFVESCSAAPYDNPNYKPVYPIIQNGCKVDQTVQIHSTANDRQFRFSIEAFKFIGLHDQVYITCSVLMCRSGNPNTRCAQGCINGNNMRGRRKRETVAQSSAHLVSQGPLRLRGSAESRNSSDMNLNLNLVFVVGCLLAAVGMISGVALYKAKVSRVKYQPLATLGFITGEDNRTPCPSDLPQLGNFHTASFLHSSEPATNYLAEMNAAAPTPGGSKAAPPKFKQKETRQFKSKAPKAGQKGFDNDVPGMEGLGDSAVVCPWEAFGDMELSDLAQFGIV